MNLTKEQKQNIIDLHFKQMKSQNEIVSITGINKRWVNEICKAYASMKELSGLGSTEATPQVTLFPSTTNLKPAPKNFDQTTPNQTHQQSNWGYPSSNTYELEYKDRRIKDLETDKSDLRRKLEAIENELASKAKELQLLQLDHRTIEKNHDFEIKFMQKMQELDKKPSIADKILGNDTVLKLGLAGLMGKMGMGEAAASILGGVPPTPVMDMPEIPTHPLTFNTNQSETLNLIYQVIASMPEKHLETLMNILAILLSMPESIENTLVALKAKVEKTKQQQLNTQA
jgi:hypothetical protein